MIAQQSRQGRSTGERGGGEPVHIEFDTPFDDRYPLYTRANAGEVFPEVLTPLAWSLLGRGIELGFRDSYCRHIGVLAEPDSPWQTAGRFAWRLHLNLSVIRTVAERMPGMSSVSNDRNFFGERDARGLPAHVADPEDPRWQRRALPAVLRTMTSATRWVKRWPRGCGRRWHAPTRSSTGVSPARSWSPGSTS